MAIRRPNEHVQERLPLSYPHAALTATTTDKFFKATRGGYVASVTYFNKTGLAADAANYFAVQIKNGANVIASHSTQTSAQGALVADTPTSLTVVAANKYFNAGDTLSFAAVETGTQTLPAGHAVVEVIYV